MRPINPKHTLLAGKDDDGRRFLSGEFREVDVVGVEDQTTPVITEVKYRAASLTTPRNVH